MKLNTYDVADVLDWLNGSRDPFDIVLMSPPYPLKERRYGKSTPRNSIYQWVDWMAKVVERSVCRTRGDVFVVVNDTLLDGCCLPATALLRSKLYVSGISEDRPIIWHKNASPSRKDYFRNDHEYILCFKGDAKDAARTFNPHHLGQPPKFKTGGKFRQRSNSSGERTKGGSYPKNKIAIPGDVLRVTVGGGQMGWDAADSRMACSGKAPFPFKLANAIVGTFGRPGGVVCDPFAGTGTTFVAALKNGMKYVGCDNDKDARRVAMQRIDYAG